MSSYSFQSIMEQLNLLESNREKVEYLNAIVIHLRDIDFTLALQISDYTLNEAVKSGHYSNLAKAYINHGYLLIRKAEYQGAIRYLVSGVDLLEKNASFNLELADGYNGLGISFMESGNYPTAFEHLNQALKIAENQGDKSMETRIICNIGSLEYYQENFENAFEYYQKSYQIACVLDDPNRQRLGLNNLGSACLKLGHFDRSLAYLYESLAISKKLGHKVNTALTLSIIADVYSKKKCKKEAKKLYLSILEQYKDEDGEQYLPAILKSFAWFLVDEKEWQESLGIVNQLLTIAHEIDHFGLLKDGYQLYALIKEKQKDYQAALENYKKFLHYSQKIKKQESEKILKEFEVETHKKTAQLLKKVSQIGQEITARLDLTEILTIIYQQVSRIMDASFFGIALFNEKTQQIEYKISMLSGNQCSMPNVSVHQPYNLAGLCLLQGKEIILNHFEREIHQFFPEFSHKSLEIMAGHQFCFDLVSALYAPLRVGGEVIGVMTIQSSRKNAYQLAEIDLFMALSQYASIALNNGRQAKIIQDLAKTDPLTGIVNRRQFEAELNRMWKFARRKKFVISLLLADIDFFKEINDQYGHLAGDYCLKKFAHLLKSKARRAGDCVARYGGEEFAILLDDVSLGQAGKIAEEIRQALEKSKFVFQNKAIKMTVSIGVSFYHPDEQKMNQSIDLIHEADKALYKAKHNGRNRVEFF